MVVAGSIARAATDDDVTFKAVVALPAASVTSTVSLCGLPEIFDRLKLRYWSLIRACKARIKKGGPAIGGLTDVFAVTAVVIDDHALRSLPSTSRIA